MSSRIQERMDGKMAFTKKPQSRVALRFKVMFCATQNVEPSLSKKHVKLFSEAVGSVSLIRCE